jgi:phage/plasmid-like protein (TIGR03299 family)
MNRRLLEYLFLSIQSRRTEDPVSHDINVRNGEAAVMVVGQPAWHNLGTVLDKPATAAQAISAAKLDWEVIKQPLFAGESEHWAVPDYFAVVRGDDWQKKKATVLGIVGKDYTPLQNRDAFQFFDPIVGEKAAAYHTAGALGEGERVWILAKLPEDIQVIGDDITNKFLLLSNSHDGGSAVQIKFTPIRVVCQNTLTMALREGPTLRIAHTKDVHERLRVAANLLNAIKVRYSAIEKTFGGMVKVRMNGERLSEYLLSVFPDPTPGNDEVRYQRALNQAHRDRAESEYRAEFGRGTELKGVRGTLWGAYNGVAEYIDYSRFGRFAPDRQVQAIWFGDGYSAKARAYRVAEEKAKTWSS